MCKTGITTFTDKTCTKPPTGSRRKLIDETKHSWKVGEVATIKCKDGYEFVSPYPTTTLTCGNDEQWIGSVTECTDATCSEPSEYVTNGYLSHTSLSWFTPLSEATYTCNENYKLSGYDEIKTEIIISCTWNWRSLKSTWVPSVGSIHCTDIVCPIPNVGPYQILTSHEFKWKVGSVAHYECDTGYEFTPVYPITSITCRRDETWNGKASNCQENIKCANPKNIKITNGHLQPQTSSTFYPGDSATFWCNRNHKISGQQGIIKSVNSTCLKREHQIGSEWSLASIECEEILCRLPPVRTNHVDPKNKRHSVGYIYTHTCKPGYIFPANVTKETSECRSDGTWTDPPPDCIEDMKCADPDNITIINGHLQAGTSSTFYPGDSTTILCNMNHKISGRQDIIGSVDSTCIEREEPEIGSEWSLSLVECEEILCDAPPVQNNHVEPEPTHWSVGYIYTYTCKPGYIFPFNVTGGTSECSSDGTWSDPPLDCIEEIVCKNPPMNKNHYNKTGKQSWKVGESYSYKCKHGYVFAPIATTSNKCSENGSWTVTYPTDCVEDMSCGEPPLIKKNSERIIPVNTENRQFLPGEIAMYRCKDHFYLNNTKENVQNISCTKVDFGSKWKPELRRCRPIKCPKIKKTKGLSFTYNVQSRKFDTIATFSCKPNRVLEGKPKLQCSKTGKWSGPYPVCKYVEPMTTVSFTEEVHLSTKEIVSPTTTSITTEISTTTVSIPTTTTPTTTIATTESSTSTSESITENKQKMDLMIMLPASKSHSYSDIDLMKNWLKSISRGLSTHFNLRIAVVQYYKAWDTTWSRRWTETLDTMKMLARTQEDFEMKVDQVTLKHRFSYHHFDILSSSAIEKSRNIMLNNIRQDAIKSIITLFRSYPRFQDLSAISKGTACIRHLDINTFIVGIGAEKRDIQKMASGLLSDAGVFMRTGFNHLESTVAPLMSELKKLSIPVIPLIGCSYGNIPLLHDGCSWSYQFKMSYSTGEEINAHCNLIFDNSYTKCRNDGTWSSLKQPCSSPSTRSSRSIGCSKPWTPDNGYIINDPGSYKAGTKVHISCVNGFTLVGKSFMKCKSNGKWTRTNSVCKANRCFVDPYLFPQSLLEDGAYLHYREVSAGESVTLQCESPSVLHVYGSVQDEVEITCELGGTWYPDVMQQVHCDWGDSSECQNPSLLLPKHALFVDDLENYPINTILYMECPEGFIHLGDDYITCKANGEWSIPNFSCIGQLDCEEPHPPENSEFDINLKHSYRVGETEIFHCLGDYVYDGNRRRIECLADGTWSNPDGHCIQEQYCTGPLIPELAYIVDDPEVYYPGIEISIKCVEDHIVIGCSRMTCARTGRWSSCMNQCQAIICQLDKYLLSEGIGVSGFTPEELYHNKYNIDDTVVLSCSGNREPFLIGATSYVRPEITCNPGAQWEPKASLFHCQTACYLPEQPSGVHWSSSEDVSIFNEGEIVEFECEDGYIYGSDVYSIVCQDDGSWIAPNQLCIPHGCLAPDPPQNSYFPQALRPSYEEGDIIRFTCQQQYIYTGSSSILRCFSNRTWSNPDGICKNKLQSDICACPSLPEHAVVVNDPKDYPLNTIITITCEPGFLLAGDNKLKCEETGHWSHSSSTCQEIDECEKRPCRHNGVCSDGINDFSCSCPTGYSGKTCEIDIDDCSSNPCHNGYCSDGINNFICFCRHGFTGTLCQTDIDECSPNPCLNGGLCSDGVSDFFCFCPEGFDGARCQNNIDDCSSNPCQHGGQCADALNGFKCTCADGYEGDNCETDSDDCSPNPCQHGGRCVDAVNGFHCVCADGYEGDNCETNIDDCNPSPCINAKACVDGIFDFTCECQDGYAGKHCQTDIDDCSPNPCQHGGQCADAVNGFKCTCADGYEGDNCETDSDDCSPNPCQHEGRCVDAVNGFKCDCADGYEGNNCETDSDDCSPNPCQHGGRCVDEVNGFHCVCADGYEGDNCETNIDDCNPSPCVNAKSCVDGIFDFTCECQDGYTGKHCQTDIDDCSPNPCQHGGQCADAVNGFKCTCADGYEGDNCETDSDDCSPNPCQHEGRCVDAVNGFKCDCADGYEGNNCETDSDDCSPNPCQHGGRCVDEVNGFHCVCADGYEGDNCETNIDDCNPSPCVNAKSCVDGIFDFTCECQDGYTGKHCQTDIDDCSPNPCQHGGQCADAVNGFKCTCADGYEGDNCETDSDDCSPNPCQHEGRCVDAVNGFKCDCADGYEGNNCETDSDDCSPNPCQHGGRCVDEVNGFHCVCADGYEGDYCETNIDDCNPSPCVNAKSCVDGIFDFTCECQDGYTGKHCQTDIDDCSSNPCKNGGSCTDKVNNFSCECRQGYEGKSCETNIDDCVDHDCQHGGKCQDELNGYVCVCTTGYIGLKCETNQITCLIEARGITEETFTVLCPPGCDQYTSRLWGTEIYSDDSYICAAGIHDGRISADQGGELYVVKKSGQESYDGSTRNHITSNNRGYVGTKAFSFTGFNICEDKCRYDIRCERRVDDFYCECYPGYSGKICDIDIDDCNPNPCQNDGKCTDDVNDFSCQCAEGYQGKRCEIKTDLCNPNPCRHVERCENRENDFYCVCIPGYTGKRCEIDINDCLPNPCQNGGHCIDEVNDFSCQCEGGFEGKRCEAEISCKTKICLNGGFCKVSSGIEVCFCPPNYAGNNCEADVNECLSNPCVNNGICGNLPGSFLCECPPGFTGKLCEEQ
uniref:sushi, von Willebrand factor type A, EGF and pentraxin domain-containing protein 1-like n=1 Tax=Styela clava TaxID=7725 RepID=UPI00193A6DB1|nr:sushi, von Willebrand factor type A, EGF and pentraxin domain-containing protein 1-like [Styela clava]